MDENMRSMVFRVLDKNRNLLEEEVDANDDNKLKTLSDFAESYLILQTPCGNPVRCTKGWHDALLYIEGKLWVQLESVQNPLIPTMLAVGRLN